MMANANLRLSPVCAGAVLEQTGPGAPGILGVNVANFRILALSVIAAFVAGVAPRAEAQALELRAEFKSMENAPHCDSAVTKRFQVQGPGEATLRIRLKPYRSAGYSDLIPVRFGEYKSGRFQGWSSTTPFVFVDSEIEQGGKRTTGGFIEGLPLEKTARYRLEPRLYDFEVSLGAPCRMFGSAGFQQWSQVSEVTIDIGAGGGSKAAAPATYSKWTSVTPNSTQFPGQPGHTLPVAALGNPTFETGQYMIYTAVSDPQGQTISIWWTQGPFTLGPHEKWKITLSGASATENGFRMEKNPADLMQYSDPGDRHAMIYVRNEDKVRWRSICVLPVGSGKSVLPDCFGGSQNVVHAPRQDGGSNGPLTRVLFVGNNSQVYNGPTKPTVMTLSAPTELAKITTYHWNNGRGAAAVGTIALRSAAGATYGPWQAVGGAGLGGAKNVYWIASPSIVLPAGAYTVVDSDPTTWAQNEQSGGVGHAWAEGRAAPASGGR